MHSEQYYYFTQIPLDPLLTSINHLHTTFCLRSASGKSDLKQSINTSSYFPPVFAHNSIFPLLPIGECACSDLKTQMGWVFIPSVSPNLFCHGQPKTSILLNQGPILVPSLLGDHFPHLETLSSLAMIKVWIIVQQILILFTLPL